LIDSEATMSKFTRALVVGTTLAAMNLAGMTAVAHAQANDQPASSQGARRPPTERQVGESWHHRQVASQQQTSADAALRRLLARERSSIPNQAPAQVTSPVRSAGPSGQPGWLLASLAVLAAALALALAVGLAVRAARRASRRARLGQAA
jgi:hypothetical protein